MHPMIMKSAVLGIFCTFLLITALGVLSSPAQQRPTLSSEEDAYGAGFFDELRTIFGKFRNADLQRVFEEAKPIQCSELVGRKGEWRPVAFFNEDRSLGDWCRESINEVKADMAIYAFKGSCVGEQKQIQVATEFPTEESMDEYRQGRINLNQVDITVNDPVDAIMNSQTKALTFNLPYLFLTNRGTASSRRVYTYIAPNRNSAYAQEVTGHWECKAVASEDVTYRFLICRVATVPRGKLSRNQKWEPVFGSSAFFILSDGTEAKARVKIRFGDGTRSEEKSGDEPEQETPSKPPRPTLKRK
jgi:hypothetical protein